MSERKAKSPYQRYKKTPFDYRAMRARYPWLDPNRSSADREKLRGEAEDAIAERCKAEGITRTVNVYGCDSRGRKVLVDA